MTNEKTNVEAIKRELAYQNTRSWVYSHWDVVDMEDVDIDIEGDEWECRGWYVWEDDAEDETPVFGEVDAPWYGAYYTPALSESAEWIEEHAEDVAACGFVLIYRNGRFWGLGVNGAGYSFVHEHWMPLYELRGAAWLDGAGELAAA